MKKTKTRLVIALAIPLAVVGASMPTAAFADQRDPAVVEVRLQGDGATVVDPSGGSVEHVVGNPEEGESVQVVESGDTQAIVTVQYGLEDSPVGPTEPAPESEEVGVPEPDVEVIGENTFWSGNFGDSVDREAALASEPEFASAVTSTSASFDWSVGSESEYTVLRDGKLVGSSSDGRFVDDDLEAGQSYDYLLSGAADETGNASSRSLVVHAPDESSATNAVVQPLAFQPYTTAYDYKTFIPNEKVNSFAAQLGCGLKPDEAFRGDNRGFAMPGAGAPYDTPGYRTQMFFNVNWDNQAPYDLAYVKSVGQTKKLSWYNTVIDTRTASANGMVFQNPTRSGNLVTFGVSHEVGDPFCAGGAVRYSLTWVKIYRSGTVSIQGSRQPVPSHEAYARFSSSNGSETWKTLYRATGPNFNCLLPAVCASENINKSISG